ncbi:MAG TPA: hypothetical protein VHH34_24895 [Pseudonocardiaceae bacterium]|nr:hypothetical protein [Pseudonocardiaceae bacterium]
MSTVAVIGLGVFVWILLSVLLALFVGRMIQARDRQRPDQNPAVELPAAERARTAPPPQPSRQDPRDKP